jgi:hypothetical protein
MTPDDSLTTAELPRPPSCAGGCEASILDADDAEAWTVTDNVTDEYMRVWCPTCLGNT